MAGLGSFVEGFTGGVNQGNAWQDRKRNIALEAQDRKWLDENRDWARGDRTYTVEERTRLRTEQDRQLKAAADERDAAASAWNQSQTNGPTDQGGRSLPSGVGGSGPMTFGAGVLAMPDQMSPGTQRSLPAVIPGNMPPQAMSSGPVQQIPVPIPQLVVNGQSTAAPGPTGAPLPFDLPPAEFVNAVTAQNKGIDPVKAWATVRPEDKALWAVPAAQAAAAPPPQVAPAIAPPSTAAAPPSTAAAPPSTAAAPQSPMDAWNGMTPAQRAAAPAGAFNQAVGAAPSTPTTAAPPPANLAALTGRNAAQSQPGLTIGASAEPGRSMPPQTAAPTAQPAPQIQMNDKGRAVIGFNNPMTISPEVAKQAVSTTLDHYRDIGIPKLVDFYMKRGDIAKAQALQDWSKTNKAQDSMKDWVKTAHSFAIGDGEGTITNFANYINGMGTGVTVDRAASKMVKDASGNVQGIDLVYSDASGKKQTTHFSNMGQVIQDGIFGQDPGTVWSTLYAQQGAAALARGNSQKLETLIQVAQIRATAARWAQSDPATIARITRELSFNSAGSFDKLPQEQQLSMINDRMNTMDAAVRARQGGDGGDSAADAPLVMYGQ